MNARQKAKRYKKIAESYKAKAEAFDRQMRLEAFKKQTSRYGTIETLKIVKFWDDRMPEELIKKDISRDIAECLLREGYISFITDESYNVHMIRKIVASVCVTKTRGCDEF